MDQQVVARARPHAIVHIGGVAGIPAALKSLGASPAEVFAEAGVDLALFDDPENVISVAAVGHLVNVCVARTGCRHFGLLVGERGGLESLGLVGTLMRFSPDVAAALQRLGHYMSHYHGGQIAALVRFEDTATLTYNVFESGIEAIDQIGDGAIAILCNVMRTFCGSDWVPRQVQFAHRRPADVELRGWEPSEHIRTTWGDTGAIPR